MTGFLRFVAALAQSQDLLLFASGHALEVAYLAGVNYVVLAFGRGRLEPASTAGNFGLAIFAVGPLDITRLEVLRSWPRGRSNKAVADWLFITEHTVEKHVQNIVAKLQIPTTTDDHRPVLAVLTFLNSS